MTTADRIEVADYAGHARELLAESREAVAAGKLHRASRTGWEAAECMARAVATAQGWEYERGDHFGVVLGRAWRLVGDRRLLDLSAIAEDLHDNRARRKRHLDAAIVARDIEDVAELIEMLAMGGGTAT